MKILLVDDNIEYLTLIKESLVISGYDVTTAEDGSDACTLLMQEEFDLIISDIKMPTLDGIMLHAYARQLEKYKGTKFVFVSAFMDGYADVLDLVEGVDFFMEKTTPLSEFLSLVDSLTGDSVSNNCAA